MSQINVFHEFIRYAEQEHLPIEGVAIADGDRVIEEHRFTPSLARNIYSHTKSYAVTGIGVAVEEGLLSLPLPAPLLVVIAVAILVGLTGSPPAGLAIVVPVLAANLDMAPEAIHRIATTAATTFDTLPFQGAIIIMLNMADLKHKDGYPPIMMCTVVWTLVASLVAAALFALFPSLA